MLNNLVADALELVPCPGLLPSCPTNTKPPSHPAALLQQVALPGGVVDAGQHDVVHCEFIWGAALGAAHITCCQSRWYKAVHTRSGV